MDFHFVLLPQAPQILRAGLPLRTAPPLPTQKLQSDLYINKMQPTLKAADLEGLHLPMLFSKPTVYKLKKFTICDKVLFINQ